VYATDEEKLEIARWEALEGREEGGIPIGAALFDQDDRLLGSGRNQRVQGDNPALHGETSAFLAAGRQRSYRRTTMVTTLSPCWYCSGLVRQFGIGRVVIGENTTFYGGEDWLRENGVDVHVLQDPALIDVMTTFIDENPSLWNEDIGEE
jgi:cytosine deaminase